MNCVESQHTNGENLGLKKRKSCAAATFSETLPFFAEFLTFSITKHQIAFFHAIYQISFSWDIVKTSSKLRACLF